MQWKQKMSFIQKKKIHFSQKKPLIQISYFNVYHFTNALDVILNE